MNVELLRRVKDHILEEPRRLRMSHWIGKSDLSPCGTVACIAGWTAILAGWNSLDPELGTIKIEKYAMEKLEISEEQADCLFYSDCWPGHFQTQYYDDLFRKPDDLIFKLRATVVAEVIEDFIRRNTK